MILLLMPATIYHSSTSHPVSVCMALMGLASARLYGVASDEVDARGVRFPALSADCCFANLSAVIFATCAGFEWLFCLL